MLNNCQVSFLGGTKMDISTDMLGTCVPRLFLISLSYNMTQISLYMKVNREKGAGLVGRKLHNYQSYKKFIQFHYTLKNTGYTI